jgi:addiction module HigA family antidote
MAIKVHPSLYVHPGDWIKTELVEAHGLSVTDAADLLKVTRQALSALLNSRAGLSPDMAIRLEKLFGISADTLIRMQANYDLRTAREHEAEIMVERLVAA